MLLQREDIRASQLYSAVYADFARPLRPALEARVGALLKQSIQRKIDALTSSTARLESGQQSVGARTALEMIGRVNAAQLRILHSNLAFVSDAVLKG